MLKAGVALVAVLAAVQGAEAFHRANARNLLQMFMGATPGAIAGVVLDGHCNFDSIRQIDHTFIDTATPDCQSPGVFTRCGCEVHPLDSMRAAFDSLADSSWKIVISDQWGLDSGAMTEVCVTPSVGATPVCNTTTIPIPDRATIDYRVVTTGETNSNPSVTIRGATTFPADLVYFAIVDGAVPAETSIFPPLLRGVSLISFNDIVVGSGNIGGRAAALGNFVAGAGVSVGSEVCAEPASGEPTQSACYVARNSSLVVGGDLTWTDGGLYPRAVNQDPCGNTVVDECMHVGGSATTTTELQARVCGPSGVDIPADFATARSALGAVATDIDALADTATVTSQWSGLTVSCNSFDLSQKVTIPVADFNAASWATIDSSCPFGASWIFEISGGADVVFSGGDFGTIPELTMFYIPGTRRVEVQAARVPGGIFAIDSHVHQAGGDIRGFVFANNFTADGASLTRPTCYFNNEQEAGEIEIFIGERPALDEGRRQAATQCPPLDVLLVPTTGQILPLDIVTVAGAHQREVEELLHVGPDSIPAFRFTVDLPQAYPNGATVELTIGDPTNTAAKRAAGGNFTAVDYTCPAATTAATTPEDSGAAGTAAAAGLAIGAIAALIL